MSPKNIIEEKLIRLVEERPFLFDTSHDNYRNTTMKENAWSKISQEIKDKDMTAEKCQSMWTSLRNQFTKDLKNTEMPTGSGAPKRNRFRHAKLMAFLTDCTKRKTSRNFSFSNATTTDTVTEDSIQDVTEVDDLPEGSEVIAVTDIPTTRSHQKFNGKSKKPMGEFERELLGIAKSVHKSDDDEFSQFCNAMAPKLRRLATKNPKEASNMQLEVHTLFHKYEQEYSFE